jgi:hypothetical protein
MANEKIEELAARISVADISSAVAVGLQRALDNRQSEKLFIDRHIIFGGRLEFTVQAIIPQVGAINEVRSIG